jgi:subtilisin family serine protease
MSGAAAKSARQRRAEYANTIPKFSLPDETEKMALVPKARKTSDIRRLTLRGYADYFSRYGVRDFHSRSVMGEGVSIFIIDCGLKIALQDLINVKVVSLFGEHNAGSKSYHGIAVSSLVAAIDNGDGYIGIAPGAVVTLIDVDDSSGDIRLSSVLTALDYAHKNGADIVNISLGTAEPDDDLQAMVKKLVDSGIHVFAAAGNSGARMYEFPAACPGVISVGSLRDTPTAGVYLPSTFNSRNDTVTVFAPGQQVGVQLSDSFDLSGVEGTSFASPFAAAMLALHLSELRRGLSAETTTLVTINSKRTLTRTAAITYLRTQFRNDCQNHLYVQENFSDFGCTGMNFSGNSQIISQLTCKRQTRMAMLWASVSFFLAIALIVTVTAKTKLCNELVLQPISQAGSVLVKKFCRIR